VESASSGPTINALYNTILHAIGTPREHFNLIGQNREDPAQSNFLSVVEVLRIEQLPGVSQERWTAAPWLRVGRLLGKHGIPKDSPPGRRMFQPCAPSGSLKDVPIRKRWKTQRC